MLSEDQRAAFLEDGFLVLPRVLPGDLLREVQEATGRLMSHAAHRSASDADYDLAPGHSPADPRVNRIKEPYRLDPAFDRLLHSDIVFDLARDLIGPDIRLEDMPLNMKAPGGNGAIEWHQDWGFTPYTNDAVITLGVFLCDCDETNGALRLVPGTHRHPGVFDHHHRGRFCGAIAPDAPDIPWDRTVTAAAPAGSISIHHARTVHGSGVNRSERHRPLQIIGLCAADAWPLAGIGPDSWDRLERRMVQGRMRPPRLDAVPVRLPFPPAEGEGSIYSVQAMVQGRSFAGTEA